MKVISTIFAVVTSSSYDELSVSAHARTRKMVNYTCAQVKSGETLGIDFATYFNLVRDAETKTLWSDEYIKNYNDFTQYIKNYDNFITFRVKKKKEKEEKERLEISRKQ